MTRLVLLVLLMAFRLAAQFGGGIQGTILDSSGRVIPGVHLKVVSLATGVARDAVSSESGLYRVPSLSPGEYTVLAEIEGFQRAEQRSVTVAIDEVRRVDFTLQVGNVTEKVTVVDKPTILETEKGRLSGRLDSEQLRSLPAPGRNVFNLLALQPGVTGRGFGNDVYAGEPQPNMRAAGQRQESNFYSVDDTNINSISRGGTINLTPNIDSVAEIRVTPHNFSAEEGRNSGAAVQVLTKSGTNAFHGTVSEYFQNNTLSARNVFEASVPVYRQHQFGYSIGGPVVRNRTFFFHTYEGLRNSGARASVATVETEQFRDFVARTRPNTIAAKLLTQYKPIAYPTSNFRDLGTPMPGVNVWGPADGIPDVGNVTFVPVNIRNGNQFNGRLDHELRPGKDRLYGSWYRTKGYAENFGLRPDFVRPQTDIALFANVNHTHIFTPTLINEFRAGVMRLRGLPSTPNHLEVPNINVTGSSGYQNAGNYPGGWFQTSFTYRNTLSWIRGGHNLKFGGELRRMRNNLINTSNYVPAYSFASILDFADDEAIQMQRAVDPRNGEPAVSGSAIRIWEWAGFIQDDWKVRRNLTVNLGVRYEYYGPMTDAQNRLRGFLFGSGSTYSERLANGRVDIVKQMWPTDKLNLGPRMGFAWDIGGSGRNVIRGGYGLAYDRLATVVPGLYRGNPPLNAIATLGTQFGTAFTYTLGDPTKPYLGYPADPALRLGLDERNGIRGARVQVVGVDPGFRNPYTHDFYFGLQRALPGQFVIEAGYLATMGHHLINVFNPNRFSGDLLNNRLDLFNPSFSNIQMSQSTSKSAYHGGTVTLRRQLLRGVSFQTAFTYGKVITDAEGAQSETPYQDANNRRLDRALASFDVPQRVSFMGVWDLPFFRSCQSIGCRIAGGWQLSGYGVFEKGLPFSVLTSAPWPRGDFNADGTNSDRPDAPTVQIKKKDFSRQEYLSGVFPASLFGLPTGGRPGNLGRNTFRGPGFARVDASFGKNFAITERVGAFLRMEAFNALNRVNLNAPIGDLTNINFGRSTSAQNPRSFQMSLQIRF